MEPAGVVDQIALAYLEGEALLHGVDGLSQLREVPGDEGAERCEGVLAEPDRSSPARMPGEDLGRVATTIPVEGGVGESECLQCCWGVLGEVVVYGLAVGQDHVASGGCGPLAHQEHQLWRPRLAGSLGMRQEFTAAQPAQARLLGPSADVLNRGEAIRVAVPVGHHPHRALSECEYGSATHQPLDGGQTLGPQLSVYAAGLVQSRSGREVCLEQAERTGRHQRAPHAVVGATRVRTDN